MPGARWNDIRRPAAFIGYFFLFPLRLLLGLTRYMSSLAGCKGSQSCLERRRSQAKPAEAAVSPAATEAVITEAPVSSSEPTSTPESDQK